MTEIETQKLNILHGLEDAREFRHEAREAGNYNEIERQTRQLDAFLDLGIKIGLFVIEVAIES